MTKRIGVVLTLLFGLLLAACVSADPGVVAEAVNATLTAIVTPTPIVVVVTTVAQVTPASPTQPSAPPTAEATTLLPPPPPTAEPTMAPPTVEPEPTLPPTLAATPTPDIPLATSAPPVQLGKQLYEDSFDQASLWDLGQEDDVQRKTIADGHLSIIIKAVDRFTLLYTRRYIKNFYMVTVATAPTCDYRDRYGLLFRVRDSQNYYQFDVDCQGRYRLAVVKAGVLTPLKNWTADAAVRAGTGATNELAVRAVGKTLEAFVNGQSLALFEDETYALGGFGVYAGSGLAAPYTAVFDSLNVWEVKQ